MSGKPDLPVLPNIQNVVVYVSDDNFAQSYSEKPRQNAPVPVPPTLQPPLPPASFHDHSQHFQVQSQAQHMAAVVRQQKLFQQDKQPVKTVTYSSSDSGEFSAQQRECYVSSQNGGIHHPLSHGSATYQNNQVKFSVCNSDLSSVERHGGVPGRLDLKMHEDCDARDNYVDVSGYVTVRSIEGPSQSVRCESVRSETAESSCSSLSSSTDEGVVIVQNQAPEMVVYDPGVCVRPGGVVVAVGPTGLPQQQTNVSLVGAQAPAIMVPYGWKRLLNNGSVIYISPSNTALSSPEQVKDYLQTAGTCKCGLECPFKYESVFNFDPKVVSKPWILTPDSATGDLTKLCNHKRKIITMASLECKPPDPNMKIRKDINIKRKKRKIAMPCGNNILPQMIAQDKFMRGPHPFSKDHFINQQIWAQSAMNNMHFSGSRLQNFPDNRSGEQVMRISQESSDYESGSASPMMIGETMIVQQPHDSSNISQHSQNVGIQLHQHSNQNQNQNERQMFSIRGTIPLNNQIQTSESVLNPIGAGTVLPNGAGAGAGAGAGGIVIQGQLQNQAQRILVNGQPGDQNSPGRPGPGPGPSIQMMPFVNNPHNRQPVPCKIQGPQFYNNQYSQVQHYDNTKYIRPYLSPVPVGNNPAVNGFKPSQVVMNPNPHTSGPAVVNSLQRVHWQNKLPPSQNQIVLPVQNAPQASNMYERVPPLHQSSFTAVWQDEIKKKRSKLEKKRPYNMIDYHLTQHPPCPNIDVRQIPSENNRPMEQVSQNSQPTCSPSFLEDPSGYLAQQTALLNSTINRQTGVSAGFLCPNPNNSLNQMNQGVHAHADNMQHEMTSKHPQSRTKQQNESSNPYGQILIQNLADSSALNDPSGHCKDCPADHFAGRREQAHGKPAQNYHRSSKSSTPCSPATFEDPVTSSTSDKGSNLSSPSALPIQGGTISTSNISSNDGTPSGHSTPVPHTPTPPQHNLDNSQELAYSEASQMYLENHQYQLQNYTNMKEVSSSVNYSNVSSSKSETGANRSGGASATTVIKMSDYPAYSSVVTTMASGRTVGSNTITSVLAGRTNTATVSINNPMGVPVSTTPSLNHGAAVAAMIQTQQGNALMNKSPLEMVQSVVSSIQVPHSQHPGLVTSGVHANIHHNVQANLQTSAAQIMKQTSSALPPGHIFVSSGGQLLMANTGTSQPVPVPVPVMPPPPPPGSKMIPGSVSPMAASSMITNTNVTAAVTQMIPAVAQQVLGQQTVLVNALQAPFVLQPGVTMTMDGMTVGQNVQIPQLVAGNVIQHQIQIDNSDLRNAPNLLSPETKKKGKKRKVSSQTVANMLQIAAQQNSNVVVPQQGFPQHIQMHSPQGITAGSVMQALTLVPSKNNGAPQIVMNGQTISNANHLGAQQLIANSQPAQQINLLQPVNIINSGTGVVPNFPTIQQFILPNLGGMVMNPDGTATLLQDTSNLGMQLQIQTVNGQNVLTPVQNNPVFSAGQNIIASGPTGMVIRSPTSQGKIIQQQHSPGAQFLSPNSGQFVVNSPQFGGQISPLLAGVSPQQQVTFNTSPQQVRAGNSLQQSQQEFIHCGQLGQTLMVPVPCSPTGSVSMASSSNQNTTYVQQNTTIVQQQTTMVSGNQEFPSNAQPSSSEVSKLSALNVDEKFLIGPNDNKHLQAMIIQADSPNSSAIHRQSVSTQTAVNQNHSVTTNTFCQTTTLSAGSPPDTTTHSPLSSSGEQSPPNADTTTHPGNIDDGLSPSSSNCSAACEMPLQSRQEVPCTMPMVHCISSSEPDSADIAAHGVNSSDNDWSKHSFCSTGKTDYLEGKLEKKSYVSAHVTYPESSTVIPQLHYISGDAKNIDSVGVSKQQQRRKKSQSGHHLHSSVIDD